VAVVRDVSARRGPACDAHFVVYAMGSGARGRTSDVALMVVGKAAPADLSSALRKAEQRLGREVNATVYSPEELREKYGPTIISSQQS
jgi:hypothetical protein